MSTLIDTQAFQLFKKCCLIFIEWIFSLAFHRLLNESSISDLAVCNLTFDLRKCCSMRVLLPKYKDEELPKPLNRVLEKWFLDRDTQWHHNIKRVVFARLLLINWLSCVFMLYIPILSSSLHFRTVGPILQHDISITIKKSKSIKCKL